MKHNSTAREQSLHPTTSGSLQPKTTATSPAELDDRILMALGAAGEKKAIDSVVLDLREIAACRLLPNLQRAMNGGADFVR